MANLGLLGSILDRATGGWGHYYNQQQAQQGLLAQRNGLLGALPMPEDGPPAYAAPMGPDGQPLADPDAGRVAATPYPQRYMSWLADIAKTGFDPSKHGLPTVNELLPRDHQDNQGNVSAFSPLSNTAKQVYTAPPAPYSLDPTALRFDGNNNVVAHGAGVVDNGPQGAAGLPPLPTSAPAPTSADALWSAVKTQESGNRPGVLGPMTRYGQAQGLTQMLPATAQAMAAKLGVSWRPDLMTGTTPEAASYQDRLGRAYFDEGMQRSGGDPHQALMYYHGGPDQRIWGPKTHAYADQVLARAGGQGPAPSQAAPDGSFQVAANGPLQPGMMPSPSSLPQTGQRYTLPPKPTGHPSTPQELAAVGLPTNVPGWTNADGKPELYPVADRPETPLVDPSLTGDAVLQALKPGDARIVQMIAQGKYPLPTGKQATDPKWKALLDAAAQYDPTLDVANVGARSKTRANFVAGPMAANKTALNTAIGHLAQFEDKIDPLNNFSGPAALVNGPFNYMQEAIGNTAITDFKTTREAVVNEMVRVFRGGSGAEADIKAWKDRLKDAQSPEQLHSAVKELAGLLYSRAEALATQYNEGMGTAATPLQVLSPDKAKYMARWTGQSLPDSYVGSDGTMTPPKASPAAPAARTAPAPPRALPKPPASLPRKPSGPYKAANGFTVEEVH